MTRNYWIQSSFAIFFFITASTAFSQNTTKSYSGIVKDSLSNSPAPYVNVFIKGSVFGTVSNESGEFTLKVPIESSEEITFSAIGYATKTAKLSNETVINEVILSPIKYHLNEVVVSGDNFDSADYILNHAIENIKFNNPVKPHLVEGFFRELTITDTTYSRLIEAAVRIQEVGYQKNTYDNDDMELTRNRARVIELRKSDDYREKDLLTSALNLIFGDRNELYMLLSRNYIRVLGKKSGHALSSENLPNMQLTYEGKFEWEGQVVYNISASYKSEKAFQWSQFNFYINKSDYAIVRVEYYAIANPDRKDILPEWLIEGKYFLTSEINYRKIKSRYVPYFIHSKSSPSDASGIVQKDGRSFKQYIDVLFLLTNVYEDDYSKVKWKDADKRDKDLYENKTPYNEVFWANYNTVRLNPLKKDPKDLERKRPLKDQYRKN